MIARPGWFSARLRSTIAIAMLSTLAVLMLAISTAIPVVADQPPGGSPVSDNSNLQFVPADAAGFVHLHLAEIWKNDLMTDFRKTWEKAGEKAIAAFNSQFIPTPSTIDKLTVFVMIDPVSKEPIPFAVVGFSAPFDAALVAELYLSKAEKAIVGSKVVYTDKNMGTSVIFPDSKHALFGDPRMIQKYLEKPVAKDGPLSGAIQLATKRPIVAAVNVSALPIPPQAITQLPPNYQPLTKAELLVASLTMNDTVKFDLIAKFGDEKKSEDALKAFHSLADLGRTELAKAKKEIEDRLFSPEIKTPRKAQDLPEAFGSVFALGGLNQLDELLADPNLIKHTGSELAYLRDHTQTGHWFSHGVCTGEHRPLAPGSAKGPFICRENAEFQQLEAAQSGDSELRIRLWVSASRYS